MKKILFPTDFSNSANNAFQYAILLAEAMDASIDILHVYNVPLSIAASIPYNNMVSALEEKRQALETRVEELVQAYPRASISKKKIVYGVFVSDEIADLAKRDNYDLIVMGMKGEHDRVEKWIGTITTNLMMKVSCPVLAIPEKAKFEGIKKIAFATDFKSSDKMPISQVLDFADLLKAELEFVYVNTLVRTKQKQFANGEENQAPDLEYTKIVNPSVVEGLDEYLRKNQTDVLSLYIPRRRLWERLFHHRTSKAMAFHTKIPLLIFQE